MAIIVNTQPNREAEAIGAGLAAFGANYSRNKRYQEELKRAMAEQAAEQARYDEQLNYRNEQAGIRAEDRALDMQDRQTGLDERAAEQEYNAQQMGGGQEGGGGGGLMSGLGNVAQTAGGGLLQAAGVPFWLAGKAAQGIGRGIKAAAGGIADAIPFHEAQQQRVAQVDDLVGRMSPEAGRLVRKDFREAEKQRTLAEMARVAAEGLTKIRKKTIDSARQGSIGEDKAAAILPDVDPSRYVKNDGTPDIEGMLQATAEAEQALVAARESMVRQQTDDQLLAEFDQTFVTALDAARPAIEAGVFTPEEIAQGRFDYNMLRADWGDLTPTERDRRSKDLLSRLDFRARAQEMLAEREKNKAKDPRAEAVGDKTRKLFMEGVPGARMDDPPRDVSYDEAARMAQTQGVRQEGPPTALPPQMQQAAQQATPGPAQQGVAPLSEAQQAARAAAQKKAEPFARALSEGMRMAGTPQGNVEAVIRGGMKLGEKLRERRAARGKGATDTASAEQARPAGVQPMAGKRRSRTEILGGDRGPEQDPTPMHEAVAKAIALGIPLDQFQDIYGIDLSTLTEDDLRQIEVMSGGKRP